MILLMPLRSLQVTAKAYYDKLTMNPELSIKDYELKGIQGIRSHSSKMSELVFSFDDIEMDNDMNPASQSCDSISLLSPSPSSSASQSGYVTISDSDLDIKWEGTFTELYEPDASRQSQIANRDERRRTSSSPLTTSSPPDSGEQRNRQESLLLHVNAPQESAHSPTPESTTPRTRRFQDSMLSLLSLLPPERYLSPSPSIEEGQFEEAETQQYDFGAYAASPALPVRAATADGSSANRLLSSSSCLLPKFLEDQSECDDSDDGTGLRKRYLEHESGR